MTQTVEMATDEQVDALVALGIDEADAGSYDAKEAAEKLATKPAKVEVQPTPCECGCEGTSRGAFVPGHDAKYKSQLARMLHTTGDEGAVFAECDRIDALYGRTGTDIKWRGLVTKMVGNLQKADAAKARKDATKTPVQRAKRAIRTAPPINEDGETSDQTDYIDDLMDRLNRVPRVGQVGWLRLPEAPKDRMIAKVSKTRRDQGISEIEVTVVETGVIHSIAPSHWLRDEELEKSS